MAKKHLYIMIAALLLLNMFTIYKLNSVENNINNKLQQSDMIINSLRNDINNISLNVETNLKKQGSILDSHNVIFGELNTTDFTVPITVSLTPKEYSKGLAASLETNNKKVSMKNEGTSYVGTVDANIFDDITLKVDLNNNGIEKIETIEGYHDLKSKYLLTITGGFNGESSSSSNQYQYNGKIALDCASSKANNVEKISIINDVNGAIFNKREIKPSNNISVDINDKIELKNGEKLITYALVQDKYGFSYKYIVNTFEKDMSGKPVNDKTAFEMRGLTEISDRNGKVLYNLKK